MLQMASTFGLEEWLEYIGLLAAISGLLLILSAHLAIAIQRRARGLVVNEPADADVPWPDTELLLWTTIRTRGVYYLAVGGAVLALAKIIDL